MPSIRILGGIHKQRTIAIPHCEGLRPTAHRLRQSAFDILVHRFHKNRIGQDNPWSGLRVLDVCAGLGGYGFEALSRGADHATFIEQTPTLAKHIVAVAKSWNIHNRVVVLNRHWPMDVLAGHPLYDVIFLDPPYDQSNTVMSAMISACAAWIKPDGILLVESDKMFEHISDFTCIFHRAMGKKQLSFWQKSGPEEDPVEKSGPEEDPVDVLPNHTTMA